MKGLARSVYYWMYNMEKTFAIMFLTVTAIVTFQVMVSGRGMDVVVLQMYVPMVGSIMLIALLMNNATHFIPQSLSYGGTRKEVFIGMELSIHLMMIQIILISIIGMIVMPKNSFSENFLYQSFLIYLICEALGNFLCACSLKFGMKIGMILYMILVILASVSISMLFVFSTNSIVELMNEDMYSVALLAVVLLDGIMVALCYLAIRKYEVRS